MMRRVTVAAIRGGGSAGGDTERAPGGGGLHFHSDVDVQYGVGA